MKRWKLEVYPRFKHNRLYAVNSNEIAKIQLQFDVVYLGKIDNRGD